MIETDRLVLRRWRESDKGVFAEMNADPAVMEFFPSLLSREESDSFADRLDATFDDNGYGIFAVEVKGGPEFIGFVGLMPMSGRDLPVPGDAEVGWRLVQESWGRGYATEAALASLRFGFDECDLDEIVSLTATINLRSQQVMRKIGMHRDEALDFDHPRVPKGPLQRHVVYRLTATEWRSTQSGAQAAARSPE